MAPTQFTVKTVMIEPLARAIEFVEDVFNILEVVGQVEYPLDPGYFDW